MPQETNIQTKIILQLCQYKLFKNALTTCSSCSKCILFPDVILDPQKREEDFAYSEYYLKQKCQKGKFTLYQQTVGVFSTKIKIKK